MGRTNTTGLDHTKPGYSREYYRRFGREKAKQRYLEKRLELQAKYRAEHPNPSPRHIRPIPATEVEVAKIWVDRRVEAGTREPSDWASDLRHQVKQRARRIGKNKTKRLLSRIPVGISTQWIRDQFARQQGRCFYTGIPMVLGGRRKHPRKPSLDRIDSTRAYTPDNCVLCLCAVNFMKNDYTLDEFMALLEDIRTAV